MSASAESMAFVPRHQPFSLFTASAGAGKTFRLAGEYLALAMSHPTDPTVFKRILAVTFTNKAANEMRERILGALHAMAQPEGWGDFEKLAFLVMNILELTETEVRRRARATQKAMLHDYGAVSIGTIDKFTYRLVRAFRHDIGLPDRFTVELDSEGLRKEAVAGLLDKVGIDPVLTQLLSAFASENVEEEKNWDVEKALLEVAEHFDREKSQNPLSALAEFSPTDFLEEIKNLKRRESEATLKGRERAASLKSALNETGVREEFSNQYLPKWLDKLQTNKPTDCYPSASIVKMIQGEVALLRDAKKGNAAQEMRVQASFYPLLKEQGEELIPLLTEAIGLSALRRNLYTTAALGSLQEALDAYCESASVQPISKFNGLIYKHIKEQPSEYIFERIGDKYQHFFIDEAQDTSRLQWENLWPLLENSLSQSSGTAMVVGDGKQSVYRWRGSEAEQFLIFGALAEKHLPPRPDLPSLQGRTEQIALQSNFRSRQTIVEFNNRFFSLLESRGIFQQVEHRRVYSKDQVTQYPKGPPGGYVRWSKVEGENAEEMDRIQCQKVLEEIQRLKAEPFCYKERDMAVIVRKNDQGILVAKHLIEAGISVVSSESLALGQSVRVQAIVCLLRALYEDNAFTRCVWVRTLRKAHLWKETPNCKTPHALEKLSKGQPKEFWEEIRALFPLLNVDLVYASGLYSAGEAAARGLGMNASPDPFLQFFLDELLAFEREKTNRWEAFSKAWEDRLQKKSIVLPAELNAVQIMTIHKAKGLEYPVVLFPFANWSNKGSSLWMSLQKDPWGTMAAEKIPVGLIAVRSAALAPLRQRIPELQEKAAEEETNQVFDDANLFYVAMTRPKDVLIMWTPTVKNNVYLPWFSAFLASEGDPESTEKTWGKIPTLEERKEEARESRGPIALEMKSFSSAPWTDRVQILPAEEEDESDARQRGEQWHRLMESIRFEEDVSTAVALFCVTQAERSLFGPWAEAVVRHPALQDLFERTGVAHLWTERPLLAPKGDILRPDRIVERKDGSWAVLEYKTGKPKNSHRDQVDRYADRLKAAVNAPVSRYLVYLCPYNLEVYVW